MRLLLLVAIIYVSCFSLSNAVSTNNSPVSLRSSRKNGDNAERFKKHVKRSEIVESRVSSNPNPISTVSTIISSAQLESQIGAPWYFSVFPIYPKELAKFFSLSFMMFWIVFVFTMTRDTKDALIVTNCGAEAIAFLKVYGVVPAAALFMVTYAKLANMMSPQSLFYCTLVPFFIFYAVFAFVLYPLRDILHPLSIKVPEGGLSFAVNLLRHWTFSLYYIVTELWGSAGIPLLFWSCANDVVQIDQAKRLYPLIALIGNLGPILSGVAMTVVSNLVSKRTSNDEVAFETSLKILTAMMCGAGTLGKDWG
jgi:AAA family ATP:ADP antiporter